MTAPTPVTHDLTHADVEAGTWVRMVSTWPDGATVEHYGPVSAIQDDRVWIGTIGAAGYVYGSSETNLATLTHFSRVDPPAPGAAGMSGDNAWAAAVERMNALMSYALTHGGDLPPEPAARETEPTPAAPEPDLGAVMRDRDGREWVRGERGWGMVGHSGQGGTEKWKHLPHPMSTPEPTPAAPERQEAAEALARVTFEAATGYSWDTCKEEQRDHWRKSAEGQIAAIAAGRVPGVRVVGDGEVVVSRADAEAVWGVAAQVRGQDAATRAAGGRLRADLDRT